MSYSEAFLVSAPPELQQQGIGQISLDDYNIHSRIKELDRRLFLYFHPFGGSDKSGNPEARWQVYRSARSVDEKPFLLQTLEEKDGSFRPLDQRVIHDLEQGDLHASPNAYADFLKRRKADLESKEREWANLTEELGKDAARALALDGHVHAPKVSLYISDNERRKGGGK